VFAVKGKEDMTIHVRDRGGGIPRRLMGSIFEYLYTTANPVITSSHDIHVSAVLEHKTL
jgi:K+-sensing histidine kinase KdpD